MNDNVKSNSMRISMCFFGEGDDESENDDSEAEKNPAPDFSEEDENDANENVGQREPSILDSVRDRVNEANDRNNNLENNSEDSGNNKGGSEEEPSLLNDARNKVNGASNKIKGLENKVRGKAKDAFDKSGAKEGLNKAGKKAGDGVSNFANKAGDAVGGNAGKAIGALGGVAGNKMGNLGTDTSNKIGDQGSGGAKEVAGKAYDAAADAAAMAAGKAAAAAAGGVPVVDKAVEAAAKKILKSEKFKKILKLCGILLLGAIAIVLLILFVPVILLFALVAEIIQALLGVFEAVLSGLLFVITYGIYDYDFEKLVENKLDKIYTATQEMPKNVADDPGEIDRPQAPKSNDEGKTDREYTEDVATNIPRERMKMYVQSEYSTMLFLEMINMNDIMKFFNAKTDIDISYKIEIDIPSLYGALDSSKQNGKVTFGDMFWQNLKKKLDITGRTTDINKLVGSYMNQNKVTYDTAVLQASGDPRAIERLKKEILKNQENHSEVKGDFPEGLEEILAEFPTTDSFFAPLENSTGNPVIYRGEDLFIFKEYVTTKSPDKAGYTDWSKCIIDEERTKELRESINEGELVPGNPVFVKYKYPTFYSQDSTLSNIQKMVAFFTAKNRVTNFEDNTTRAFVMDIARLVYSNPEHTEANTPTNITIRTFPNATRTITTSVETGTYTTTVTNVDVDGNSYQEEVSVDYSVPKVEDKLEIKPEAKIVKIEDWDRIEIYEYEKILEEETVVNEDGSISNIKTVRYDISGLPKRTITSYPQQFTDDYKLDSGDFGVYEEITGKKFLCDEVLYNLLLSDEYAAAFENSKFVTPLAEMPESVTSYFGETRTINGVNDKHSGIDLAVEEGTPVYAIADGEIGIADNSVTTNLESGGYGTYVTIKHEDGMESVYAHLSELNVKAGQKVAKGDLIGFSGNTGRSTGAHLHFEIREDGKAVNPLNVLTSAPIDDMP